MPRTTTTRSMRRRTRIPNNAGGFIVTVAIADVAAYVRPGTALDREAQERGNSVYFPDRVVPMLPERISNDLCSLAPARGPAGARRPHGDRRRTGARCRHSFHRVMMRSAAKLSYQQAQAAIDGRPDETTEADPRYDPQAALGRLCGGEEGARHPRAALPRSARAQDRAEARRHGGPGLRAGAARGAQADRGIHDPRQRSAAAETPGEGRSPT